MKKTRDRWAFQQARYKRVMELAAAAAAAAAVLRRCDDRCGVSPAAYKAATQHLECNH